MVVERTGLMSESGTFETYRRGLTMSVVQGGPEVVAGRGQTGAFGPLRTSESLSGNEAGLAATPCGISIPNDRSLVS
jgi:hypothetical protein